MIPRFLLIFAALSLVGCAKPHHVKPSYEPDAGYELAYKYVNDHNCRLQGVAHEGGEFNYESGQPERILESFWYLCEDTNTTVVVDAKAKP